MTKKLKHPEKISKTLIIVGPMPFPWSALKDSLDHPEVQLIFIDGGLVHLKKFKSKLPHLVKTMITAGDGDSSKKSMILNKTSQNFSDLAFLLSKLTGKSRPTRCLFVGFLGGRIDHQLFNLGEIALYLKKFSNLNAPYIQMDKKIVFIAAGIYQASILGIFSLASFEDNQIKITGNCEYQAKTWLKLPPVSSRGVSNVGYGQIRIESMKPLAIIKI